MNGTNYIKERVMTLEVICRPLTAEERVRSETLDVEFLVNNTALGQVFLTLYPFTLVGITTQMLHTHSCITNGIQS